MSCLFPAENNFLREMLFQGIKCQVCQVKNLVKLSEKSVKECVKRVSKHLVQNVKKFGQKQLSSLTLL
jgi:hypothetical protein